MPLRTHTFFRQAFRLIALGSALAGPPTVSGQPLDPIVVVPFVNLSPQLSNTWIGIGIAKTITNDLQHLGLAVLPEPVVHDALTSVEIQDLEFIDGTVIDAGRTLGARWIVAGVYQRNGDLLRITTRLIDVRTGEVREGFTVDTALLDLFSAQDQIVTLLADSLIPLRRAEGQPTQPQGLYLEPQVAPPVPTSLTNRTDMDVADRAQPRPGKRPHSSDTTNSGFAVVPTEDVPVTTIRRTTVPPRIDGRLDDAVWQDATHVTEFTQIAPAEGAPGTERTEVWMAYDSANLYFAFYAHYSNPGMMRINRSDRDDIRGDDQMSILFDTFLDQQRAYQFEVNGYGIQADSLVNADGSSGRSSGSMSMMSGSGGTGTASRRRSSSMSNSGSFGIRGDDSWNALFDTGGQVTEDGWTAEMAIPFKSLRYPSRNDGEPHRWGFQITRRIREKSEAQSWSPVSRAVAGQLTQFGILEGLEDLSQSRNLEILPQLTGLKFGSLDTDNGQFTEQDPTGTIGVGVKYGLTPNLTADLTYNPDFSQIESDQPQIETNQRFALFYPEQRPFFLEGQEIFQISTPLNLLNTRTIIDPRFGGKLTGKVGNTSLGFIVADDEAAGRLGDRNDPQFGTTAQTLVGRARYDFYSESYLGAIVTTREFQEEHNRVAGIDGRFRLGQTHRLSFMAVGSSTHNETDGNISGPAIEADFTHQSRNLGYGLAYTSIDPEFWTESGFLQRVDLRQTSADVSYRWWPESSLLTWGPTFTFLRLYDHAGILQNEQIQGSTSFTFVNNCNFRGQFSENLERYQEVNFRKTGYGMYGGCSKRRISIFGGFNGGDGILFADDPYLGRSTSMNIGVYARPTTRLSTQLTAISSRFVNPVENVKVFDVKIFRTRTTYQFTDRFLVRHIMDYNSRSMTLGNNLLLTYRINAGTVAFLGYDDRFQSGTHINDTLFLNRAFQRVNHAIFTKVSYLFRY